MSDPKFFMHLGAHKTASTFIQHNLVENRDWLEVEGWRFIYMQRDHEKAYNAVLKMRGTDQERGNAEEVFDRFLKKISSRKQNTFFSSETILGNMSIQKSGEIYPYHEMMIDRVRQGVQVPTVGIGFCVREYGGFIESGYNWLVTRGASYSFKDYIAKLKIQRVSWLNIIAKLIDTFGIENVHVWTFEDFKQSPPAYIAKLLEIAGIDVRGRLVLPHTDPVNVSYSQDTLPLAIAWNKILKAQDEAFGEKHLKKLRRDMRALLAQGAPSGTMIRPRLLDDALRLELAKKYQEDVAELQRRWPQIVLRHPTAGEKPALRVVSA
jgi:hypothetical protein